MSLHSLFLALGDSALGHLMKTSKWDFALTEMLHLIALALLGGSLLVTDLRLLGVILKGESAITIGRDLSRVFLGSLTVLILTGIGLLSEEAGKCYFSPAFRWKMTLLAAGILFYLTVHRRALRLTDKGTPTYWSRASAVISLALWLGVGVAGRVIGLL